jgi:phosphoribosylaminoimidazolecarboxamide formyltransferase/IMP cyclohydrolase
VLAELRAGRGEVSLETNRRLAHKVFATTARYDGAIAEYLGGGASFHWSGLKALEMRYGENPHQHAALYGEFLRVCEPLHGKELSFNNVVDVDAALSLATEFMAHPEAFVAILKHNTPCGAGLGRDPLEAWERAYATDPESPFGGIVVSTKPWTLELARAVDEIFTEVLIAPAFEAAALDLLRKKKNRRLVLWHPAATPPRARAIRSVVGGLLVQDQDTAIEDLSRCRRVTMRTPTDPELRALDFAWRVVKHVKSNAIVFATDGRTLAVGGGQTSRVEAIRNAVARAARQGISLAGSVLASDAFFPFADGLEEAANAGVRAVVQPGGSTRDEEVIAAADQRDVAMILTGVRHFRH